MQPVIDAGLYDIGLHKDSISKVNSFPPEKSIYPESLSVLNS